MLYKIAELGDVKFYPLEVLLLGWQNCLQGLSVNAKAGQIC